MLGATLAAVLNLVKSELRASLSVGTADDALIKQAIETKQEWLASEYDWSELKDQWDVDTVPLTAGRYTAFPTTDVAGATYSINFDRPVYLETKWNTTWQPVCFGISSEEYNCQDSDEGENQDPVQHWDFKPGDRSYFEIWPLASTVYKLRFHGQRKLKTLRAAGVLDTTKVLDLDDQLVALAVAVDYLTGKPEQASKNTLFTARFNRCRGTNMQPDKRYYMGGNKQNRVNVRRLPIITTA